MSGVSARRNQKPELDGLFDPAALCHVIEAAGGGTAVPAAGRRIAERFVIQHELKPYAAGKGQAVRVSGICALAGRETKRALSLAAAPGDGNPRIIFRAIIDVEIRPFCLRRRGQWSDEQYTRDQESKEAHKKYSFRASPLACPCLRPFFLATRTNKRPQLSIRRCTRTPRT